MEFVKSLDSLLETVSSSKGNVVKFLYKHFKENTHYVKTYPNVETRKKKGGQNKVDFFLTLDTFNLVHDTFNRRNRYICNKSSIRSVNLLMTLEEQTIGFLSSCFLDIYPYQRQYHIGKYRVDICFTSLKLILECDEFDHNDRNEDYERIRGNFILSEGFSIIRFNPNDVNFSMDVLLRTVNKFIAGTSQQSLIRVKFTM